MKTKTVRDVDVRGNRYNVNEKYDNFNNNLDEYDLHLIKILLQKHVDECVKHHNEYCIKRYGKSRKVAYNTGLGRHITALDKVKQTIQLLGEEL